MTASPADHRDRLHNGSAYAGAWLMSASADAARVSSAMGFDYVCIDMQHGFARAEHLTGLIDAIRSGGDAMVVVRVPENRFAEIGMVADAGADAIIVPLVSSADEARRAAEALAYPSEGGDRSFGPTNALLRGASLELGTLRPLLFVMIENEPGLAAVDEIVAVDGVDGIYVGPSDLAFAAGSVPGPEEQGTTEAIARILEAAQRAGVIPGIHTSDGETARARFDQGFRLVTSTYDLGALRRGYSEELAAARGEQA